MIDNENLGKNKLLTDVSTEETVMKIEEKEKELAMICKF